ncbi:MAG: integration host factor subunit beta [Oligosphaeraceae bacterium]|nr:integration host factor subunit beta [Oligosphaeraceae bacterium]
MSLTKRKIALAVAARTRMTQQMAFNAVQATLDVIVEELSKGGHIELRGFGVFEIVTQKPRVGRNPNNPTQEVKIPARKVVKFRAGRKLAENVRKLKV